MFVSHRTAGAPSLDARLETHAVVHTSFRLHVVRNRNVVSEDALLTRAFDRKGAIGRPVVTIVLAGHGRVRIHDREVWLSRGDVSVAESKAAIVMRQGLDDASTFRSVALEWDVGALSRARPEGLSTFRLDELSVARIEDAASWVTAENACAACAARSSTVIVETLRAAGLPFDPFEGDDWIEPVPARTERLSRALDHLLSDLRARPMVVDLDAVLGLSERQIHRVVSAFNAQYGFNAGGWRDTRNRRRLMIGATLMTAPRAHTEAIAAAVGYGSPAAFCRALAEAKLPSPGSIARVVRTLE